MENTEKTEKTEKTTEQMALELAQLMEDGKGQDVCVLDISALNSWTDYFVIVTVTSGAQAEGLYKYVKDYNRENGLEFHQTSHKSPQGSEWMLLDVGSIVIHLMTKEARDFYELEKLWHAGRKLK